MGRLNIFFLRTRNGSTIVYCRVEHSDMKIQFYTNECWGVYWIKVLKDLNLTYFVHDRPLFNIYSLPGQQYKL